MDLPEELQPLIDHLGQAIVQAVAGDARCHELAGQIQALGWDMALMVEATVALHKRDEDSASPEGPERAEAEAPASPQWSEEDRAWLHRFKIRLD